MSLRGTDSAEARSKAGRIWKGATTGTPFDVGFLAEGHQRPKSRRYTAGWPNIFKGDCSIRIQPKASTVLNVNQKRKHKSHVPLKHFAALLLQSLACFTSRRRSWV